MLNATILLKIQERLNKLASSDYDNIEPWQSVEAFNKGMTDWCRRNLHGLNVVKEGDEQSTRRIDDLQILITSYIPTLINKGRYYETSSLPEAYLQWKRFSCNASNECCPGKRPMKVYMAEEANVDILLADKNKKPSFDWAETFGTLSGNKFHIYTNGEFTISDPVLMYYAQPTRIQITGIQDPYTGLVPTVDVECQFKEDLIELFVDEAVKILSGDIEAFNQSQRESQAVESNN